MPKLIFWREGYDHGTGGTFVRAAVLNHVIEEWEADVTAFVVGIRIDPEHGSNVELLLLDDPAHDPDREVT